MRLSTLSSTRLSVMGAFLIFGGCLSIALGISSATPINGSYPYGHLGYGIWGGLFYVIVGILTFVAAFKKFPELVMWCLVLNIVCCIIGVLQLALGISAANQDFNAMWLRFLKGSTDEKDKQLFQDYKNFYEEFFPMTLKIAESGSLAEYLHNGVVAVDSLLAIAGFIVAIASAIAASSLGRVICCPELLTDLDSVVVVSDDHKDKTVIQVTHENSGFDGQA